MAGAFRSALASSTVLYAGCLVDAPFVELVGAARAAGFDAVSAWPLTCRRALRREGLDIAGMRGVLDDHGVPLSELEGCDAWLPGAHEAESNAFGSGWTASEFLDTASALGGDTVVVSHVGAATFERDDLVEAFASFCDRAVAHGLRVALEPLTFGAVPTFAAGAAIVGAANRPNGGLTLDTGHLVRGGWQEETLRGVPPTAYLAVQLADGPVTAPSDLLEEARLHRLLPGEGEFPLDRILSDLAALGVTTRVGPEIFISRAEGETVEGAAVRLATATASALAAHPLGVT